MSAIALGANVDHFNYVGVRIFCHVHHTLLVLVLVGLSSLMLTHVMLGMQILTRPHLLKLLLGT